MEIISFEKRTFEEIAAKLDYFVQRVESLCREHGGKETGEWMDNHEVCRRLRISPRAFDIGLYIILETRSNGLSFPAGFLALVLHVADYPFHIVRTVVSPVPDFGKGKRSVIP